MKIEKFTIEFYEEVVQLWRKAGISVGSSDSKIEVEKMLERNPTLFLIGKIDDKICAVVMGGFDGRRGYVHHLAVDPVYQRRGHGKLMIDELNKEFLRLGVHKIHLFIQKHNREVVVFYQNQGWEIREDLIMMSYVPDKNLYKMRI
ncbi:MAG: GNAT family N-acetyltransferase [Promethearchaeota archaeon]|jgi:ribosomal protein S18 acetylase RimI-like enzyme